MSNIVVVHRFQNPWVLMYALNSSGTATYPGLIDNFAALFLTHSFPLPSWASPTMTALLLAVSPFLPCSSSGTSPLYCPTIDLSFVGYSTRGQGLGSKGSLLLLSIVMPLQNKATIWA